MFTKDIEKEKSCVIYTSDFHLEMIILPYISKKLENKENIIIMTEEDIKDTVEIVLSKININEDKKNDILKLDWKNNNINKLKQIEQNTKQKSNLKIINCYQFEEISGKIPQIISKYNNILNTLGEEKI